MQLFSIFIVFALLFAFFVGGGPIPVEAQPQELPDSHSGREPLLRRFAWVACAYRMLHLDYWGGTYDPEPSSPKPLDFATYVTHCVPAVLYKVRSLPSKDFVEELCAYRCTNTHGLGFEDTRFPEGVETCADKCKLIYASLLEKVKEPWDEAADVENAKKIVEENDQQLRDEARAKQKIRIKLITKAKKPRIKLIGKAAKIASARKSDKQPRIKLISKGGKDKGCETASGTKRGVKRTSTVRSGFKLDDQAFHLKYALKKQNIGLLPS